MRLSSRSRKAAAEEWRAGWLALTPDDPEHVPLHLAIYRARPDVNGIVSGHTPHGRTFSARGETIRMLWQDSCFFAGRVPVLPFLAGVNAAKDPGAVTDVLDDGKGLIMQNRGLLMTAATIEGAIATYIRLENLCGNQLLVEAAVKGRGGTMIEVGEEEVKVSWDEAVANGSLRCRMWGASTMLG